MRRGESPFDSVMGRQRWPIRFETSELAQMTHVDGWQEQQPQVSWPTEISESTGGKRQGERTQLRMPQVAPTCRLMINMR